MDINTELNQIIQQVIMKLDNNDKYKLMTNIKKKEIVETVIYNLLKDCEDKKEKDIEKNKHSNLNIYNDIDDNQHMLLSSMYH